jgi:hypothetical protein
MSKITVDLDIGIWLNNRGQVQLFIGENPESVETITLIDLVRMEIDSHKVCSADTLDRDEAKKFVKLKKALTQCLDHLNRELTSAK